MIHAYSELYLNDAKETLAQYFDYIVNDCNLDSDRAAKLFIVSGFAKLFECGNPSVVSGMSGVELAQAVLRRIYDSIAFPKRQFKETFSPEYWTGWALAWYQWHSGRRFRDILDTVCMSEIVARYQIYHEMDINQFFDLMDSRIRERHVSSRLKTIRENRGLSQSELSKASGVGLWSIQMYEQDVNDINKAQAISLYRLSRVLGCSIEDLLQNPYLG